LHLAARGGHKDAADLLIAAGADVKSQTTSGGTPLHYAACGGSTDLVKYLLAKGAPVNAREHNDMTPLHWASRCGHAESVSLLLTSGAEIDTPGEVDWTALHEAAINSRSQVLNVLLEKKAVIGTKDDSGMTPLHWAADRGEPEIVRPLLTAGGDAHAKDKAGRTPVSIATQRGHDEVLRLLKVQTINSNLIPQTIAPDATLRTPAETAEFTENSDNAGKQHSTRTNSFVTRHPSRPNRGAANPATAQDDGTIAGVPRCRPSGSLLAATIRRRLPANLKTNEPPPPRPAADQRLRWRALE
jgi:ankyrin repeat protein